MKKFYVGIYEGLSVADERVSVPVKQALLNAGVRAAQTFA